MAQRSADTATGGADLFFVEGGIYLHELSLDPMYSRDRRTLRWPFQIRRINIREME